MMITFQATYQRTRFVFYSNSLIHLTFDVLLPELNPPLDGRHRVAMSILDQSSKRLRTVPTRRSTRGFSTCKVQLRHYRRSH